jgi:hypothetical protein
MKITIFGYTHREDPWKASLNAISDLMMYILVLPTIYQEGEARVELPHLGGCRALMSEEAWLGARR